MRYVLLCIFALATFVAAAAQPARFNYQAKVNDGSGVPLSGAHTFWFSIYEGDPGLGGATLLYQESVVLVADEGVVSHGVGTGTGLFGAPLKVSLFQTNEELFLRAAVDSELNVIAPATRLDPVPFAIASADGERRFPIDGPLPLTISEAGSYYLTNNLLMTSGLNGITINTSNVVLDMNGFALASTLQAGTAIMIAPTADRVTIRNGTIHAWSDQIVGTGTSHRVSELHLSGSGDDSIALGQGAVVSDCIIEECDRGLSVGRGSHVSDCMVRLSGFPFFAEEGSVVERCVVRDNSAGMLTGQNCVVSHCNVSRNEDVGISCSQKSTIIACVANENDGQGLFAGGNSLVQDCVVTSNTEEGIVASAGATIRNCSVANNRTVGISANTECVIESNTCRGNGVDTMAAGILVESGSRVANNQSTGNGKGISSVTNGSVIENNVVHSNAQNYEFAAGQQLNLLLCEIPESIDWPAKVTLAGSLTGVSSENGITITSDDVTIDLNGHTLRGVPGANRGIVVDQTPGRRNIVVRNGIIADWPFDGLDLTDASNCLVEDVVAYNNDFRGIITGENTIIRNCTAEHNGFDLVPLPDRGAVVGDGIRTGEGCSIIECTATENHGEGISTDSHCLVENCVALRNGNAGIEVDDGCTVQGSVSCNNGFAGISTGNDCLVLHNQARGNAITAGPTSAKVAPRGSGGDGSGIVVIGSGTRVEGNHSSGNTYGYYAGSGPSLFIGNTARANANNYGLISAPNLIGPIISNQAALDTSTNAHNNFAY